MSQVVYTFRVTRIDRQLDRTLLYRDHGGYHVIAKTNVDVDIGDLIAYEPMGINFGWFVKKISRAQHSYQETK